MTVSGQTWVLAAALACIAFSMAIGPWKEVGRDILGAWGANLLALWLVLHYGHRIVSSLESARVRRRFPMQRNAAFGTLLGGPLLQVYTNLLLAAPTQPGSGGSLTPLRHRVATLLQMLPEQGDTNPKRMLANREDLLRDAASIANARMVSLWNTRGAMLMQHYERYAPVLDDDEGEALHDVARRLQIAAKSGATVLNYEQSELDWQLALRAHLTDVLRLSDALDRLMPLVGRNNKQDPA